jgi:trimethylamine--corrinoid protein Co-methyltransferase
MPMKLPAWLGVCGKESQRMMRSFAIDLIKEVGTEMYLKQKHTARHMRKDLWRGKHIKNISSGDWEEGGKKDLSDRIEDDLKTLLEEHQIEPLSEDLQSTFKEITEKYKIEH